MVIQALIVISGCVYVMKNHDESSCHPSRRQVKWRLGVFLLYEQLVLPGQFQQRIYAIGLSEILSMVAIDSTNEQVTKMLRSEPTKDNNIILNF